MVDGELVEGAAVVDDGGGAVIHGAGLTASRLEVGPISSALSGVEDAGAGATMLDGGDPKPLPVPPPKPLLAPPEIGAIVAPRSFRSCAGETGMLKVG